MKRVLWKSIKFYSLVILALIAIMAFETSCNQEQIIERPSAKFILKGTALSAKDTLPLKDILVIMKTDTAGYGPVKDALFMSFRDSVRTDQDGNFIVTDTLGIPAQMSYTLVFNEKENELKSSDGRINTSLSYRFTDPVFIKGDDHWYSGETIETDTFWLAPVKY